MAARPSQSTVPGLESIHRGFAFARGKEPVMLGTVDIVITLGRVWDTVQKALTLLVLGG
ncbi:hypothetical protein GCM10023319_34320 [Nocardia iowensis]